MSIAPAKHHNLGYFNLARGIGMILILTGHSFVPFIQASTVSDTTTMFAGAGSVIGGGIMAMFFMISGFGFYSRSPKRCFATQNKLLLIPYFQVSFLMILARLALTVVKGRPLLPTAWDLLLTYPIGLNAEHSSALFGEPVKSVTILWFILALYGGWILYNGICRLRNRYVRRTLVLTAITASWLLTLISKAWPMCLPMALLACGYLAVGHAVKERNLLENKIPLWNWIVLAGIILVSCAFGFVDIGAGIWGLGIWDVLSTFCIGFILLRGYSYFMHLSLQRPLIHTLERIGNRSIWILFLHAMEKSILPWYRLNSLLPNAPMVCALLCLVIRSVMIFVAYRILNRMHRQMRTNRKPKVRIDP